MRNGDSKIVRQSGFMLIEVLISLVIVAIGLLGLAGLHLRAQQAETEAYQRAQALMLLKDIENRIRANRSAALDSSYPYTGSFGTGAPSVSCQAVADTPAKRAECDKQEFNAALLGAGEAIGAANVGAMEGARACIAASKTGTMVTYEIAVAWKGLASLTVPAAYYPGAATARNCGKGAFGSDDNVRRFIFIYIDLPQLS
jgi:type IV pilus assembly protein PilV